MRKHAILLIGPLLALGLVSCSKPLKPEGAVAVALQSADPSLASAAASLGLKLEQRASSESWFSRLNADQRSSRAAQLYEVEWGNELGSLSRGVALADTRSLWKRSEFGRVEPIWLEGIAPGPGKGFIPTAANSWGLFFNQARLAQLGGKVPSSIAELEGLFAAAKAAGITPVALGAEYGWPAAAWFTMLDLRMNGASAVRARYAGIRPWDDSSARAVAERLAKWRDLGYFSADSGRLGMPESIASVESGASLCVLMGAFAVERFQKAGSYRFAAFPGPSGLFRRPSEIADLTGFAVPAPGSFLSASEAAEAVAYESALALADAYIRAGSQGMARDSYRLPLAYASRMPEKGKTALPGIAGIKVVEAEMLGKARDIVPSFERAVDSQALQNSIPLWSSFFSTKGATAADFVAALQKAMKVGR